ncbi:MAG: FAD-binding oxidoreductase [Planctomycetaceae bacterium]|nr:FAD-binding oxidoreductase [Planctomycetaceae bacterium]
MQRSDYLFYYVLTQLEDAVGRENVSTRQSDREIHSVDNFLLSRLWEDRGMPPALCDIIVRPGSTEEVSKVLQIANYYKLPVTPWGGGSGSQGGAIQVAGGVLVDTKRLNQILEFNEDSMYVTVGTGINVQQLEWYVNERGYSLMHYPSSMGCGTLGGFLSHNGIGVLSTKYGKIDDMCLNLQVVIPNGDVINSSPVPKYASGPNLAAMFLGSEGTLGIITKASMRIYKTPQCRRFRAFLFKNITDGLACGRDIMRYIKPSIMRLYDEAETASIIKDVLGFAAPGAFMNLAVEGIPEIVDIEEKIIKDCCAKYGAQDLGADYGEKWWKNRVTFFFPGHALDVPKVFGTLDTVATYSNIEKIYWARKKLFAENYPDVRYIAHFSHWYEWGVMVYDRFIIDNPPVDTAEAIRLHNKIWVENVRLALANGGTINHHHGVGIKLGHLMKEMFGPGMQVFQGLKEKLDPNYIMNPFKMGL